MKKILKLMRPKHYIKNLLIFVPAVFSGNLFHRESLMQVGIAFIVFSALASAIYIFNDIHDVNEDRRHPIKKNRPIAAGEVSIKQAYILAGFLTAFSFVLNLLAFDANFKCLSLAILYFTINLGYSLGWKNIPFLDIALLVSGFFLRIVYGAAVIDVPVSDWVSLTVITLSIYLGLGKRRNELIKSNGELKTRKVLQYYSTKFCDNFMNVCLACALVFYSLWSVDDATVARLGTDLLIWTVPLVFFILMKYCANIENDSYGDPVDVVLHDRVLIALCLSFGLIVLGLIYFPTVRIR